MIRVVTLGKIKEKYLIDLINDYAKRINKYHKLEIIELKDNENILEEEKEMIKYYDFHNYNVGLFIEGEKLSSVEISKMIEQKLMEKGNITFFVGASNGLSDLIKSKCDFCLSFGNITIPHGLFRGLLLEQIYRSFKILNNESYHK